MGGSNERPEMDAAIKRIIQLGPDESRPGGIRTVMLTLQQSELGERFGMDIVPTSSKTNRIQTFLSGFRTMRELINNGNCDCVHIHMSENASVYRAALLIHWVRAHSHSHVIVQSHGGSVQQFFARCPHRIKRYLLRSLEGADLMITLTPGWELWWKKLLPNMRYAVIPNAVDLPPLDALSDDNKKENGQRILFLGQLGERKGTYLLISAIPNVLSKYPSAQFIFAGDGEIDQCIAYANKLGVFDNCEFAGWADQQKKNALLKETTMLVLPSKEESFGIVLLEAMSYSVPVICSSGGFMHEVVNNGQDGIVFPTGDSLALADAICDLLANPIKARNMGTAGRRKVESTYSLPAAIKEWDSVYSEVLECRL